MRLFIAPVDKTFWKLYSDAADLYNATPYDSRNSGFDLFCNGEQWGFSNLLEIKLKVAPFAVGDRSFNAAVRFFEE